MRRFLDWLFSLRRPLPWIIGGLSLLALILVAVTVSATAWEYTNSPEFCGTTCHTMPPEYTAYEISPHARVDCVDCHLGQDSVLMTVPRKARELGHVVNALTQAYEPPIYVRSLRPARDTCERCHNPDKFSSDTFIEIKRHAENEANTLTRNYMIVKTGGGSRREGLGRGIHWHIENEVRFYSDDPLRQTIPYVQELTPQGQVIEYFDVEAGLPPDFGQQVEGELHRMDCIDCHTRISHLFRSPSAALDDALARQQIDASIPFIKKMGVELLNREYASPEAGLQAIKELDNWYKENYPDFYRQNEIAVQKMVQVMQDIFTVTVFPNLHVGWQTHPNNVGHLEFPGCFRCHDGKHTSPGGITVRLECNICHSIPEVVEIGQAAPVLSVDKPGEPDSHKDSNWLARHQFVFDETCIACHDVSNPGGTDNSSFCSNSACHATEWTFAGLNAPAIRALVAPPTVPSAGQPRPVPHPIGPQTDCTICHGVEAVRPFPANHASFEQSDCTQCHQPATTETAAQAPPAEQPATEAEQPPPPAQQPAAPSSVPHALEGRSQCLVCHGAEGFRPYPANHAGRTTETCLTCHQALAEATPAMEEATPTGQAEETETQEAETETPEAEEVRETETPTSSANAPAIPHEVQEREGQCLVCHAQGSLKPFPDDHIGRSNDTCLACHQAAAE